MLSNRHNLQKPAIKLGSTETSYRIWKWYAKVLDLTRFCYIKFGCNNLEHAHYFSFTNRKSINLILNRTNLILGILNLSRVYIIATSKVVKCQLENVLIRIKGKHDLHEKKKALLMYLFSNCDKKCVQ